jgi:hypothetical protein
MAAGVVVPDARPAMAMTSPHWRLSRCRKCDALIFNWSVDRMEPASTAPRREDMCPPLNATEWRGGGIVMQRSLEIVTAAVLLVSAAAVAPLMPARPIHHCYDLRICRIGSGNTFVPSQHVLHTGQS